MAVENITQLDLRIHLMNGNVDEFEQTNPQMLGSVFATFEPSQLFSASRNLIIETPDGVFAYPSHAICWIEYHTDGELDPLTMHNIGESLEMIDQETFREQRGNDKLMREQVKNFKPGDVFEGHPVIEFLSGEKIYLKARREVGVQAEQKQLISQQLLGEGTLMVRMPGRGYAVINRQAIVRVGLYPGMPVTPNDVWHMNCK